MQLPAYLIVCPNQVSAPKDRIMLQAYTQLTEKYKHGRDKLKFATSKGQRDEALSEIRAKIKRLERILAASDQVAAFEEPSKLAVSRQSVSNLMGYWKHADRIFALLLSSWVCPCRQKHCAHLWLQHGRLPISNFASWSYSQRQTATRLSQLHGSNTD